MASTESLKTTIGTNTLELLIIEKNWGQVSPHVPFHVIGQHAEQHMRANPLFQAVMNWPDLQIHRFHTAERALDSRQLLITANGIGTR
jgi:hypothetical protein